MEEKETKKEDEIKIPEKGKEVIKLIKEMTLVDLHGTVKAIEKEFGVSASVPVTAAPVAPTAASEGKEEKSVFNVVLASPGDKKIEVIKVVRDTTQKGLKEAKDLVDASASEPQVVKENVKKEEAEELKKKFEAVGAKVELK